MIFMSQSGITDPAREPDWDAWYVDHLRIMLTVPGITSTQRFKAVTAGYPPSLVMYSIASANVFHDPYYQSVRGMGEWLPLVDRRYYRRDLFDGLDYAPQVAVNACMLVADRARAGGAIAGIEFTWLKCVGLDRSTPYRGIAVIAAAELPALDATVAVYRPVSPRVIDRKSTRLNSSHIQKSRMPSSA